MSKKKKIIKMMFIGGEGARGDVRVGQIFELPEDWLEYKWFRAVEEKDKEQKEVPKLEKEEKPEEMKLAEKPSKQVIQEVEMKAEEPPIPLSKAEVLPPDKLGKMTKKQLLEYLNSHRMNIDPKLKKAQILKKAMSLYIPEK